MEFRIELGVGAYLFRFLFLVLFAAEWTFHIELSSKILKRLNF
jgi:hypothetical protein